MTSRLTNDAFIPSVPMEMPSLTVMVPKLEGSAVGQANTFLGRFGETVQVDIARSNIAGQVGDRNEGFVHVVLGQPHGPQHCPRGCPVRPFSDLLAAVFSASSSY